MMVAINDGWCWYLVQCHSTRNKWVSKSDLSTVESHCMVTSLIRLPHHYGHDCSVQKLYSGAKNRFNVAPCNMVTSTLRSPLPSPAGDRNSEVPLYNECNHYFFKWINTKIAKDWVTVYILQMLCHLWILVWHFCYLYYTSMSSTSCLPIHVASLMYLHILSIVLVIHIYGPIIAISGPVELSSFL